MSTISNSVTQTITLAAVSSYPTYVSPLTITSTGGINSPGDGIVGPGGGEVDNAGSIIGNGNGIRLGDSGTVVDSGLITGFSGTAVSFAGMTNRLTLDTHYHLVGVVVSSTAAGASNTLELRGTPQNTLQLGSEFLNFTTLQIDSAAAWASPAGATLSSALTILDYGQLSINAGQTLGSVVVNAGLLDVEGPGTLTFAQPQTIANGILSIDATIVDSGGIALGAAGTLSGAGAVYGALSGTGTVTAARQSTLYLRGPVSGGLTFSVYNETKQTGARLEFDNTATITTKIALYLSEQIAVGAAGSLTITTSPTLTGGALAVHGETMTDTAGITLNGGAVEGFGTVIAPLSGTGFINASGGTLILRSPVTGPKAGIGTSATLEFDSSVSTGTTIAFNGSTGTILLTDFIGQALTGFSGTVAQMTAGTSATVPTTGIDLRGITFGSVTSAPLLSSEIFVREGASTVAAIALNTAPPANTYVDWIPDGSGGTEIFLSSVACFCRGTRILTAGGEVPVEQLAIGDRVVTLSGEARPIKWIGRRAYDPRFIAGNRTVLPIRIAAGALGDGQPVRDLSVSPDHAVFIDGVLVMARLLVNGATIVQAEQVESLEYFHVELETHDVILAEGTPAETYIERDNRGMFHNVGEFAALYPGDGGESAAFCALRLDASAPRLTAIRARLSPAAAA